MKLLYFLILVMLGVSGFSAYKEGYLASFHPLLDPTAQTGEAEEADDKEIAGNEQDDSPARSDDTSGSSPTISASKAKTAAAATEKRLTKEEKAERDRLAKEARDAERNDKNAAREAEEKARLERRKTLDGEIEELRGQYSALNTRQKEGKDKMRQQETAWSYQKIKTSEVEKQRLRDASNAYLVQLETQMEEIDRVIREKKKQY